MKKDYRRDYATEAFRFHAVCKTPATPAELADCEAVANTYARLIADGKMETVDMVRAVYCYRASEPLHVNDISDRVRAYCSEYYCSESVVYRRLREARNLFCHYRGLR